MTIENGLKEYIEHSMLKRKNVVEGIAKLAANYDNATEKMIQTDIEETA